MALCFLAVLFLALAVWRYGISTESIWIGEAYTKTASRGIVAKIVELNARAFSR